MMKKMVTWQPVEEAPVAKVQVIVMLPFSSITANEDWRPVVSIYAMMAQIISSTSTTCILQAEGGSCPLLAPDHCFCSYT